MKEKYAYYSLLTAFVGAHLHLKIQSESIELNRVFSHSGSILAGIVIQKEPSAN